MENNNVPLNIQNNTGVASVPSVQPQNAVPYANLESVHEEVQKSNKKFMVIYVIASAVLIVILIAGLIYNTIVLNSTKNDVVKICNSTYNISETNTLSC